MSTSDKSYVCIWCKKLLVNWKSQKFLLLLYISTAKDGHWKKMTKTNYQSSKNIENTYRNIKHSIEKSTLIYSVWIDLLIRNIFCQNNSIEYKSTNHFLVYCKMMIENKRKDGWMDGWMDGKKRNDDDDVWWRRRKPIVKRRKSMILW